MSAKRPAEHQIDEKTLQDKLPISKPSQDQKVNRPQIERKFVEIKRSEQPTQSKGENVKQNEQTKQVQKSAKKQTKSDTNLFSDLFKKTSQNNGTGLFATSTSLFSNTGSLFSTANSIFSNTGSHVLSKQAPATGLFSKNIQKDISTQNNQSIFSFQSNGVPPVKSGGSLFRQENNDDQSGDSAQLQQAQKLQSDPSKSTASYKYEEECQLIKKVKVHKFKKNGGDLIEWVDLYIQKDNKLKLVYIIAKLPATQKTIFSGLLLQKKSQIRHLNNKDENLQISCFNISKTDSKTLQRNILKLQFEKAEHGKQLFECVNQIISQTKTKVQGEKKEDNKPNAV